MLYKLDIEETCGNPENSVDSRDSFMKSQKFGGTLSEIGGSLAFCVGPWGTSGNFAVKSRCQQIWWMPTAYRVAMLPR